MALKKLPRGIRNNNPLNIRRSRLQWVHEVFKEPIDTSFCQFDEMKYGWRAAFCLFRRYMYVYNVDTIEKIIRRWAPSTENNTQAYIHNVAKLSNIKPDKVIDFRTFETLQVAAAMCAVENGMDYYPMKERNRAILLAMCKGWEMATDVEKECADDLVINATIEKINEIIAQNEEKEASNEA